jgi:hypothetical protein
MTYTLTQEEFEKLSGGEAYRKIILDEIGRRDKDTMLETANFVRTICRFMPRPLSPEQADLIGKEAKSFLSKLGISSDSISQHMKNVAYVSEKPKNTASDLAV